MIISSWNLNSVRARHNRLLSWLERNEPDVLCLQELKATTENFPALEVRQRGYYAVVHGQRTYNGVAILSRTEPQDVIVGMPGRDDDQARLIGAKISGIHVICAYFPNGGNMKSDKYHYKLDWMKRLRAHLEAHFDPSHDNVVLCGDYNVAPFDDDVARPDEWGNTVLAHHTVRTALDEIADFGLDDVVRPFFPRGGMHTWWDYRGMGFERGNGLRIDHIFATRDLAKTTVGARVDRTEREGKGASDHAPVLAEFDTPFSS